MKQFSLLRFGAALVLTCALVPILYGQGTTPLKTPFRLPADVAAPVRYHVDLTVVPDQDTFTGSSDIDVEFKKATPILWLNADKLQVKQASLTLGQETVATKVVTTPKDYVRFEFDHPIGPGQAKLHLTYQGEISRKDMSGIFQVKDDNQWYIYSQFEDIAARRAYPCFDEPGYKVPWQMTLHVKKDQAALSNTPVISETDDGGGMKTVKFAETKPLPSYLVAIAVGDFDFVDAGTTGQKHTRVRIVTPHGRGSEAKYAAETTPTIVNLLEKYFEIPYPYEKLDEVAIPLAGYAMEHPGIVTYGASLIITKPEADTLRRKRQWVSVASHELAHQWFGDLVTTAWWDDIWLNEGFASWMANKITNEYHPEWHMNISELNSYQDAMDNDALVSARKVRQPIESNDDISNAFDGITYNKGSALLNMFESYMGTERFRKGVQRYLKMYSWKNATSAEFLTALTGDDHAISSAFSSFLEQPGVPLVTVRLDCDRGTAKIDLSQQRFLPLGSSGAEPELWKIPVCARYKADSGEERQCTVLDHESGLMTLEKARSCPEWVEANADADGYYRVAYQGDLLERLLKNNGGALTLPERVSLIGDVQALTGNGMVALGTALALAPALAHDPDRQVISKTMTITTGLQDRLVDPSVLPKYRQYLSDVYGTRARQLGWTAKPDESDDDRLLRPSLIDVMANQAEDSESIATAKQLASAWLDNHDAVGPDMVGSVLVAAARHGDRDLFDRMHAAAKHEKDEQFQRTLLFALGSFPDANIASIAMPIVLTNEFDSRRSLSILFGVSQSAKTRDLAYDFVKQNWDPLIVKLPTDSGAFLPFIAGGYCDDKHRQDAKSFFDGRSTRYTGGPRNLAQVLEGIDLCVAYKKAQQPSVTEFLTIYPPAEARQLLQVSGKGVQIYTCAVSPTAPDHAPQWTLKGPDAKLYDATGDVIGTHFAGPTWQLNDGSQLQGQLPVSLPAPDPASSVPWLLLRARPGTAQGSLASVAFIQRTQTQGGVPDKSACQAPGDVGKTSQVPYSATYTFYAAQ
jgi:alanyl aminopeptidase